MLALVQILEYVIQKGLSDYNVLRTNELTDRWTDTASYRIACPQLKNENTCDVPMKNISKQMWEILNILKFDFLRAKKHHSELD